LNRLYLDGGIGFSFFKVISTEMGILVTLIPKSKTLLVIQ